MFEKKKIKFVDIQPSQYTLKVLIIIAFIIKMASNPYKNEYYTN